MNPEDPNWGANNRNPFDIQNRQARQAEREAEHQIGGVSAGTSSDWTAHTENTDEGNQRVF